jgi:L-seryl-tRNA(Ser) seleniumtransferase
VTDDRRGRAGLPQVDAVLRLPDADTAAARFGRPTLREAVRARLADLRDTLQDTDVAPDPEAVLAAATRELERLAGAAVRPVINATGVVLHTNLGRAPLSEAAVRAVLDATGYSTVEFDLATGGRGSRTAHAADLALRLTGAEAAHVVNNGAAALLLAVAALGAGKEVVVSRGELIEIGGSFRLPEIVAASGARLVEVGTTNRTRGADYRAAIGPDTALLLKVHPSNFRQVGFTEEVTLAELVDIGREHGVPVVHDAGSGLLEAPDVAALGGEPAVRASVAAGADLVLFSGDKLLGGPQAGILVGARAAVDRCRTSPLARALRIDKLQVAALEATLAAHLRDEGLSELPAVRMLHAPVAGLIGRADALAARLAEAAGLRDAVIPGPLEGRVGGGSSPEATVPSYGVCITVDDPSRLLAVLRLGEPAVVARITEGAVAVDLRTVLPEQDGALARAIEHAVAALRPMTEQE